MPQSTPASFPHASLGPCEANMLEAASCTLPSLPSRLECVNHLSWSAACPAFQITTGIFAASFHPHIHPPTHPRTHLPSWRFQADMFVASLLPHSFFHESTCPHHVSLSPSIPFAWSFPFFAPFPAHPCFQGYLPAFSQVIVP